MCGLLGYVSPSSVAYKQEAVTSLAHRGPDDSGTIITRAKDKEVLLGHTRLSILDLSPAGAQPMQSKDGRWWVSYNGEIYNHLDLRSTLGIEFNGHSDTETLVELISAFGVHDVLSRLNGMFAFCALDLKEGKLYLVRDPFGIKPLYYCQNGDDTAFASEIRALSEMGVNTKRLDENALQLFLTLQFTPSPATLMHSVKRLAPGHVLELDIETGDLTTFCYLSPPTGKFQGGKKEAVSAYKTELGKSIERQLLSDVPVGLLLSGGIDSALAAALAKDAGHEIPCFTVGYGEEHYECEISDARETARVLGLPFHHVEVSPQEMLNALPDIIKSIEEPLGAPSVMPMWFLSRKAREGVKVVLTGQGTDEPWGGYRRYQVEMIRALMPFPFLWKLASTVGGAGFSVPDTVERGLRTLSVGDIAGRIVEACALFSASERSQLSGSADDAGAGDSVRYWLEEMQAGSLQGADAMMRLDARMNLADNLLLYGDKISMAASLEARVPMLDIDLVRFVESLPLKYRIGLFKSKIVHKQMAEQYLPSEIVHRKKKGFHVPFGDWCRGPWKAFVGDILLSADSPHFPILNRGFIEKIWGEHLQSRPDRSRQVFALFVLALWWREVLEG